VIGWLVWRNPVNPRVIRKWLSVGHVNYSFTVCRRRLLSHPTGNIASTSFAAEHQCDFWSAVP
jgi:hypothetical protein